MTVELIYLLSLLVIILGIYLYFLWHKKHYPVKVKHYEFLHNQSIKKFSLLKEQGHCNVNYFLQTEKQNYLVRKFKHKSDRKAEFYIQNLAHKKGVAAKALLLDESQHLMICEFIEGEHYPKLSQQKLKKLGVALQKLHKVKLQQQAYTFKRSFDYKHKKVYEAFKILKQFKPEYVLGHNDLHAKNILFAKKVQFIDWEYAGKSDRYFDLAAIILEFKLNTKDEKTFLRSYFAPKERANHKKLNAYKVIYKTLWSVWFGKLERGQISTV